MSSDNSEVGLKFDQGKPQLSLLPIEALEEIAKVLTFGAKKYNKGNWRKGLLYSRVLDAALRHIYAYNNKQDTDPETGISHLAHAACNLLFLLTYEKLGLGKQYDDR